MAKNRGDAVLKRQREKARQAKQEAKREKRQAKQASESGRGDIDEQGLLEEFARLSEQYEAKQIDRADYERERHRILGLLGIENDE